MSQLVSKITYRFHLILNNSENTKKHVYDVENGNMVKLTFHISTVTKIIVEHNLLIKTNNETFPSFYARICNNM